MTQTKETTTGLDLFKGQVEKAKDKFLTSFPEDVKTAEKIFEREKGFAIIAAMENRTLATCTPESIFTAVASIALTGLTLNPTLQLAFLIPRGGKCCLDVSYRGMIEILQKSGKIKDIRANVVYEGDKIEYNEGMGDDYYLRHTPVLNRPDNTKIIAAYSIATFPDGSERFYLMDYKELMKHKAIAMTKNVWNAWEDAQCRKTVIRSHYKYLPKTEAATIAMQLSDDANPVDYKQAEKEEVKSSFEDATIIDEKTELKEAIENIAKSKTISELQANIDCYPAVMELPAVKKAIENKQKELEKAESPVTGKNDKKTKEVKKDKDGQPTLL